MRSEDNVIYDIRIIKVPNLKMAENRRAWRSIVDSIKLFSFEGVLP